MVQKIEQLHRQGDGEVSPDAPKMRSRSERMKGTIQKLEKALRRKVEIESNVLEKVKVSEFKRNARFAARTLRVWRKTKKEAG